jgi:hypothetical protein
MLIEVEFTSMMLYGICLKVEFVDLFDPNSQRATTEDLGLIPAHGGRKLFSLILLIVVEGRPFSPISVCVYIYTHT